MFRTSCGLSLVAVCLLFPGRLLAGGPPWLCLPVDGVTSSNADACTALLSAKLESKIWKHNREIRIQRHEAQSYLSFYLEGDVSLQEIEAALKGSDFSVPRDKLRLFGHAILEIDPGKANLKELVADLEALTYVSVEQTKEREGHLFVTVDMPYPERNTQNRETVGWETFRWGDFSSNQAARSEPPAKPGELPGYSAFRKVVTSHKATLIDVLWSPNYACRTLGAVVESPSPRTGSASAKR